MPDAPTASTTIAAEVNSWPGVQSGLGRRGELSFKLGRHEIGHLHGDRSAHFFFPREAWAELKAEGRIEPHPVFPDKQGPAARRIAGENDIRDVIAMMRANYERIAAASTSGQAA